MAERSVRSSGPASAAEAKKQSVWAMLPDVWALIKPRRAILAVGLALMTVNRVSGLVAPISSKYLFDDVIANHEGRFCRLSSWLFWPLPSCRD